MGEFTDGESHETVAQMDKEQAVGKDDEKFETDVPDVKADAQVKVGTETYPVFDVTDKEFHQNMTWGRKRVRFDADSNASNYMRNTRYNRPFYIRNTDGQGKKYVRRVK